MGEDLKKREGVTIDLNCQLSLRPARFLCGILDRYNSYFIRIGNFWGACERTPAVCLNIFLFSLL